MDTMVNGAGEDKIKALADNVILTLLARIAMIATPFVFSLIVLLGNSVLDARFHESNLQIAALANRLDGLEGRSGDLAGHVSDLNLNYAIVSAAVTNSDKVDAMWQNSVNTRLDKITDSVSALTASVAGLRATLAAQVQAQNK